MSSKGRRQERRFGRHAALAVLGGLLLLSSIDPADAVRRRELENLPNVEPEPEWREQRTTLPGYPEDRNLIEFAVTGTSSNRFYVDGSSLTVGPDKVVRFVFVARSPGGASTVSYSGVRCATHEWKDYAFGRGNAWSADEDAPWRPIYRRNFNNYQETLLNEFFCYGGVRSGGPAGSAKTIVRNLRTQPPPDSRVPRKL